MGRPKGSWRGQANPNWKGGIRRAGDRIYLLMPKHPNASKAGYVRRSVFIMSEHLHRPIIQNEVVHHINGDISDDHIENLVLLNRASHASHHHKGVIKPNSLKNLTHKYTSEEAKHYWDTKGKNRRRKQLICEYCGKKYLPKYSGRPRYKHHYCSQSCAAKVNLSSKIQIMRHSQIRPL